VDRPPITIDAAGMLSRAKRRQDYCRVWVDFDSSQWYTPDGDWSPGVQVDRSGHLKFAAASGSVFPAASYQALVYHLHGGLSTEQDIYGIAFDWSSYGTMIFSIMETDIPDDGCTWTLLTSGGGATNATPDSVALTCTAGMRGLRIGAGYYGAHELSDGDEWLKIANLRVFGQDGDPSIGGALTDILVDTGLADSYYSKSVG